MKPKNSLEPLSKLKTFKNDIAPTGFFFDIIPMDFTTIPINPIPLRIDKISNGQPTFFVLFDPEIFSELFEECGYYIDFKNFYSCGIQNLLKYTKLKYQELTKRILNKDVIVKWFNSSLSIQGNIPSLIEDFAFLIEQYMKLYSSIVGDKIYEEEEEYRKKLIQWCEDVLNYLRKRIEDNTIKLIRKESEQTESIYIGKKGKIYPSILLFDILKEKKKSNIQACFIPYLIYDDLLETFAYNKQVLENQSKPITDIRIMESNHIIIKGSITDNHYNLEYTKKAIKSIGFDLEKLL